MQEKNLDREQLAQALGISDVMVDKLLCGDVVPSRYLENQMVEVLNIELTKVRAMSRRREEKAKAGALAKKRNRTQKKPEAT
jgi:transcriptional regulator with XRE-family HTH domain